MSTCAICQDEVKMQTGMTTLACSHSYHLRCLVMWISKHTTCPCCRAELTNNEKIDDLYPKNTIPQEELDLADYIGQLGSIEIYGEDTNEFGNTVPTLRLPPPIERTPVSMYPTYQMIADLISENINIPVNTSASEISH